MEIAQAQPSDCGAYKLVLSNPNGETAALCAVAIKRMFYYTKPFSLLLLKLFFQQTHVCRFFPCIAEPMKPAFVKPLSDLKVVIGQPINLEAQIQAFPSPEVKWFEIQT